MAGLIKKQILKHLSKFAKNLSADKINLSTLRGEGELNNLELDCIALQNVMNLPTWLQINRASCNRVHVKIPWTKLKTSPICIFLDSVEVEMITCEKPRAPNGPSPIQASASSGDTSYGFTEKVLEGMTVNINSISVNFTSAAFNATFQLSQLLVLSTNPKWEKTDLRLSRITDKTLGQVLTFKKISWQTMRIVADAVTTNDKNSTTPLRLITNQSEIKMTFRRKTSDCSVIASELDIHFDDLLWVLTDSQVQSALLCVKSLRDTIERSSQQMRELGLVKANETQQLPAKPPNTSTINDSDDQSASKYFEQHTVIETAYHLHFDRVDLHICEESSPAHKGFEKNKSQGGAIQISLHDLKMDHYPYHKAASDRDHFRDDGETMIERNSWADGIIKQFRSDFAKLKKAAEQAGNLTKYPHQKSARLVENCLSVRLTDIDIHQVTTSNSKKQSSGRLINSTRKELLLPDDMPLFHFIRTEYYYPDGRDYPAPHDNIFMQINAPQIHAHWDSLIWLNTLTTKTVQAVQKMLEDLGILSDNDEDDTVENMSSPAQNKDEEHTDIRMQILMPKIFIPGPKSTHDKQPHGLEIQTSKVAVTNCRDGSDCTRLHLKNVLKKMDEQHFAKNPHAFPGEKGIDLSFMQDLLRSHAKGEDVPLTIALKSGNPDLKKAALMSSATKDVWSVDIEQLWMDFVMPSLKKAVEEKESTGGFLGLTRVNDDPVSTGTRVPFIDSFPTQLWIGESAGISDGTVKLACPTFVGEAALSPSSSLYNIGSPTQDPSFNKVASNNVDYAKTNGNNKLEPSSDMQEFQQTPLSGSVSSSSIDSSDNTASPRSTRHKKLLSDYYRTDVKPQKDDDAISQDRTSVSSTSSTKNKVISTHILVHSNKAVRLQLDHHQYLYLLRLIDTVEDVGKQLDESTSEVLSSTPSSASSTPSHAPNNMRPRSGRKKSKPVSTTSVRLSAPAADLFLILRPPPPGVQKDDVDCNASDTSSVVSPQKSVSTEGAESVKSEPQNANEDAESFMKKAQPKLSIVAQDTPPLSECGSDTLSIQGSDNLSIFGDSFTSGVYPHSESIGATPYVPKAIGSYPHETSDTEDLPMLPRDNVSSMKSYDNAVESPLSQDVKASLVKQKSGSMSKLSSASSSSTSIEPKHQIKEKFQSRNYSSDNLRTTISTSDQTIHFNNVSTAKSSSSGYESGSHDSLPLPTSSDDQVVSVEKSSRHSHSSSDASDQFVMIKVDEQGKGTDEFGSVKLSKQMKTSSISPGIPSETSSLSSSQGFSQSDQLLKSDIDSFSAACGLADSQITVTNLDDANSVSTTSQNESEEKINPVEEKKPPPEMSSVVNLHVSEGIELSVDSNDANDSVVKIVATFVDVLELGTIKTAKTDSIFLNYTPKKCASLYKKPSSDLTSPNFCLRVDSGPQAIRYTPAAAKVGHISLSANSVPLVLKSSTLANLGAFVEDEEIPDIVPMKIKANDVKLTIKDDMPAAYEATPTPDPITLHIHEATVTRSDDGTFHVSTSSSGGKPLPVLKTISDILPSNNESECKMSTVKENLVKEINSELGVNGTTDEIVTNKPVKSESNGGDSVSQIPQKISSDVENIVQNEEKKDSDILVEELRKKLRDVEAERDSLAAALQYMQEDLISSERERSNLRAQIN
ncbi:bridge-like lipid transfer protein family member 3B isoform X1 [Styela clava]